MDNLSALKSIVSDDDDPDFRGLIVWKRSDEVAHRYGGRPYTPSITRYSLFWDQLVIANAKEGPALRLLPEESFLSNLGIARPHSLDSSPQRSGMNARLTRFFERQEGFHPGKYALASTDAPLTAATILKPGRVALVRLYDAVPVPQTEFPLLEALKVKAKHRKELVVFRTSMEQLFVKIISSRDPALSFSTEFADLSRSLIDYKEALENAGVRFRMGSMEAKLSWSFDLKAPSGLAIAGATLAGMEGAIAGAIAGLTSNAIPKVEVQFTAGIGKATLDRRPFAYSVLLSEELRHYPESLPSNRP